MSFTMLSERPTLAIIGAGRVGSTLAQTLRWRGYTVTSVFSRTAESAQQLARILDCGVAKSTTEAALSADLTFLTVPDDAIQPVCEALAAHADLSGRALVHTSGVSDVSVLESAKAHGAWIGGLHPMLAIMDRNFSANVSFSVPWVAQAPEVTFGVEAEAPRLHVWLEEIVQALNGTALWLRPGQDRARYHAAGVIASNYVVTLFAEAIGLLQSLTGVSDIDERAVRQIIVHLMEATLNNVKLAGAAGALTGPILRGDTGTIIKHLDALEQVDPELSKLYRLLGLRTLKLAAERGTDVAKLHEMRERLEKNDANNHIEHSEDEGQP